MTSGAFTDKTVLITGAASGIGRAAAFAFARAGATLVLADVDAEAGAAVAAEAGAGARFVRCDVTRASEVEALVAGLLAAHGRLDCAFNNAGLELENARLADGDEALFDRLFAVNVKGVWLCMRQQLKAMAAARRGAIVNTASVAGLVGAPKHAIYAATKHAVLGLTRSAAAEYGRAGVRVNAVCPGVIRTPMYERALARQAVTEDAVRQLHPVGRAGEPDEVAAAVLWLCSDAAGFVTGHALAIDGGMTAI